MPASITHRAIAKEVNTRLCRFTNDTDYRLYEIGSIIPDSWRYLQETELDIEKLKYARAKAHFKINKNIEDYIFFFNKYRQHIDEPFYLGYLVHIMTDNYFRNYTVENNSYEQLEKVYSWIQKKYELDKMSLVSTKEFSFIPILDELDTTHVNISINFINNTNPTRIINNDINTVEKQINECVDFIVNEITNLKNK